MKTLKLHFQQVTTIIISHRTHLVSHADDIIVLDKGLIIEKGPHDVLMKNKKLYFQSYQQAGS
jgi:ATP-binding cassette subfamily B protein